MKLIEIKKILEEHAEWLRSDGAAGTRANLSGANLIRANLIRANLSDAYLSGANLRGANLIGADLTAIRADYESILSAATAEIPALIAALKGGRVNGSAYRDGDCGCLVGTLEIARGGPENCVVARNSARPAERWFLAIRHGDTPENNQVAALSLEWAEAFLEKTETEAPCSKI